MTANRISAETPRTDAAYRRDDGMTSDEKFLARYNFARQLERALAARDARIEVLTEALNEIRECCEGEEDVIDFDTPNLAMRVMNEVRAALEADSREGKTP